MGIFGGIALIVLGALCIPSLIAQKSPDAKELLDKVTPFQGWIGLGACAVGVWGIIGTITTIGWLTSWPLWWITRLAGSVLNLGVGFLLGFGMIQKFALANAPEEAKAKAEEAHMKLVGVQVPLGFASLIAGVWVILYELVLQGIFLI